MSKTAISTDTKAMLFQDRVIYLEGREPLKLSGISTVLTLQYYKESLNLFIFTVDFYDPIEYGQSITLSLRKDEFFWV